LRAPTPLRGAGRSARGIASAAGAPVRGETRARRPAPGQRAWGWRGGHAHPRERVAGRNEKRKNLSPPALLFGATQSRSASRPVALEHRIPGPTFFPQNLSPPLPPRRYLRHRSTREGHRLELGSCGWGGHAGPPGPISWSRGLSAGRATSLRAARAVQPPPQRMRWRDGGVSGSHEGPTLVERWALRLAAAPRKGVAGRQRNNASRGAAQAASKDTKKKRGKRRPVSSLSANGDSPAGSLPPFALAVAGRTRWSVAPAANASVRREPRAFRPARGTRVGRRKSKAVRGETRAFRPARRRRVGRRKSKAVRGETRAFRPARGTRVGRRKSKAVRGETRAFRPARRRRVGRRKSKAVRGETRAFRPARRRRVGRRKQEWCRLQDLNLRPPDYKSGALPLC
jgi:hypothetical protein